MMPRTRREAESGGFVYDVPTLGRCGWLGSFAYTLAYLYASMPSTFFHYEDSTHDRLAVDQCLSRLRVNRPSRRRALRPSE